MTAASIEAYAAEVAASAAPLSDEIRTKLAGMLAPVREAIRDARRAT